MSRETRRVDGRHEVTETVLSDATIVVRVIYRPPGKDPRTVRSWELRYPWRARRRIVAKAERLAARMQTRMLSAIELVSSDDETELQEEGPA